MPMENHREVSDIIGTGTTQPETIETSVPIDTINIESEINSQPKKVCKSYVIEEIDKQIKYYYIVSSMSTIGIIFAIIILKKNKESNKLLVGIGIGMYISLIIQSIFKIYYLNLYKKKLTNLITSTT